MWCNSCRQEVPGIVDDLDGRYACPRCATVLLNDAGIDLTDELPALREARPSARDAAAAPPPETKPSPDLDEPTFEPLRPTKPEPTRMTSLRWEAANWELNEKLRHVERVTAVARRRFDAPPPTTPIAAPHVAWSAPPPNVAPQYAAPPHYTAPPVAPAAPIVGWPTTYAPPPQPTHPYFQPPAPLPAPPPPDIHERNETVGEAGRLLATLVSWVFLGGAVCAFSCGAFLAAWGGLNGKPNVQQLGMPIVLLGVVSLVVGLLPQIFVRRLEERAEWEAADVPRDDGARVPAPHYAAAGRHASRRR